jgi:2-keto-4-pentenoate hydratase/2-oxohepta-3-ene-1,7-dioic acid hydratase in catechol pathway
MAVVIGSYASNVSAADAFKHIFGYVNFGDGSARELPPPGNTFFQVKSRETFCPMGPYVVTADEIPDPQKLQIRLWVSGALRQDFNTSDMAHSIADSIAWLSSVHSLEPGDIVATGTNHRGLGALHDGDLVEIETEGLGRLSFRIRDDLKRTWTRKTRFEEGQAMAATGQKPPPTGVLAKQLSGKYAKTS